MTPGDTSPAAAQAYFQRLAEMTPSERIDIGAGLSGRRRRPPARSRAPDVIRPTTKRKSLSGLPSRDSVRNWPAKHTVDDDAPAAEAFAPLHAALDRAGVRYAIGGSWASTAFGEPRLTNGVDIVADFTPESLGRFLGSLPETFYADPEQARAALGLGRPFNVIYMPTAFKFDFFSARAFPLGVQELDRAVYLPGNGLSDAPAPFVTPEDILLAKLHWFREGGEVSNVQWRDIQGIVRNRRETSRPRVSKMERCGIGSTRLTGKGVWRDVADFRPRAATRPMPQSARAYLPPGGRKLCPL